jgi:hypothetical protein
MKRCLQFAAAASLCAALAGCFSRPASMNDPRFHSFTLHAAHVWQMNLPQGRRFDASGLFLEKSGDLLTESDQQIGVFRIRFHPGSDSVDLERIPDCFTPSQLSPFAAQKVGRYDCEGVTEDDQGRIYLCEEAIHQDFSVTGSGPMIEIFTGRMEITNPGLSLVNPQRFLDNPPRSRNESLASFMRRLGICEERGSGVDKVVAQTEIHQLPAPLFETAEGFTRAVLFTHRPLREMDRTDRSRTCYLHACLRYVERQPMTNSSLRARLGISEPNKAMASRIIADTCKDGPLPRRAGGGETKGH